MIEITVEDLVDFALKKDKDAWKTFLDQIIANNSPVTARHIYTLVGDNIRHVYNTDDECDTCAILNALDRIIYAEG